MPLRTRTIAWRGVDDPERLDVCRVEFAPKSLCASGTSVTTGYALSWSLHTGSDWITEALEVTAVGPAGAWRRALRLERSDSGRWAASGESSGNAELAEPGLAEARVVDGALDCDLGLCPFTNTMPILRLGLLQAHAPPTELLMAWVDVPSLQVLPSRQTYTSLRGHPGGGATVEYASERREFIAELDVDRDGLVVDYPALAGPP